jgi:hypothetical protein
MRAYPQSIVSQGHVEPSPRRSPTRCASPGARSTRGSRRTITLGGTLLERPAPFSR